METLLWTCIPIYRSLLALWPGVNFNSTNMTSQLGVATPAGWQINIGKPWTWLSGRYKNTFFKMRNHLIINFYAAHNNTLIMSARKRTELPLRDEVRLIKASADRGQLVIPTGLYSDRSIFRQVVIPTGLYSDRSLFRQVYIPTGLYSDRSLFRQVVIPTGLYSDRSIFR